MKYLVVHPKDKSTDFLKPIYERLKDKKIISEDYSQLEAEFQKDYDMVLLLGHGWQGGLFDRALDRTVVDSGFASLLQGKYVVGIWCHADAYFGLFRVKGFATGMFISDSKEAEEYSVEATPTQLDESNTLFARLVGEALLEEKPLYPYIEEHYLLPGNPVAEANRQFMGF